MNTLNERAVTWPQLRRSFYFLVALTFAGAFAGQAHAQRAIPDDNLAYPVLITVKVNKKTLGMASGFYLTADRAVYLVTAKHVLNNALAPDPESQKVPDTELEVLSYSKDLPNPKKILVTLNLPALKESGAVKLHATEDVAIVRLATSAKIATGATTANNGKGQGPNQFLPGVMAKENADGAMLGVALGSVKAFNQVLVGNDAIIYGYPVSLGLPRHPQFEIDRPLLRKALIAGQDTQKRKIILDGPTYPGNSGGPVFQIERNGSVTHFNLIGVVVSHIPRLKGATDQNGELQLLVGFNSGYSVAEPVDFVLELINQDLAEKNGAPRIANTTPIKPLERRDSGTMPNRTNKVQAPGQTSKKPKAQRKTPSAKLYSRQRRDSQINGGRSSHAASR